MSNTYFNIETEVTERRKKTNMNLSLTAFYGGNNNVQLTIRTESDIKGQSGTAYIQLDKEQAQTLINALKYRLDGKVSATGDEKFISVMEKTTLVLSMKDVSKALQDVLPTLSTPNITPDIFKGEVRELIDQYDVVIFKNKGFVTSIVKS